MNRFILAHQKCVKHPQESKLFILISCWSAMDRSPFSNSKTSYAKTLPSMGAWGSLFWWKRLSLDLHRILLWGQESVRIKQRWWACSTTKTVPFNISRKVNVVWGFSNCIYSDFWLELGLQNFFQRTHTLLTEKNFELHPPLSSNLWVVVKSIIKNVGVKLGNRFPWQLQNPNRFQTA